MTANNTIALFTSVFVLEVVSRPSAARVTGRARTRRSARAALGSRRWPCTQARRVISRAPLVVAGVGAAEGALQLVDQPVVELVRVVGGRASRALAELGRPQRGARGRRAAVGQRAHGGRAAVWAERGGAGAQRGT